ncbi:L-serine ammonia-lyase, iron-sulfur-dependent, subunit alpha [Caproiciproducens sp. NJN-50]|uniref:L-serine ammonia-lyase, iron-sulfur-dependent, subunit alpha n=1 Tax=Acutalibacteraceae TaxID=3082771 RepID=UPI000FFE2ADE|nr:MULTISPECIES: L-serine ammonia-lyase, iron-sulfur-dependent, subunit alpha [Acutalibacteraceae]QAT51256.1 L-serine ammonia-lyase, iron-sulfur-dependent, subunit alpha [Caproiciproducens sp. NJN-50]
MAFVSVKQLLAAVEEQGLPLWEVILNEDVKDRGVVREDSFRQMNALWAAMKSASEGYSAAARSKSGLVGGDGEKMRRYALTGNGIAGAYLSGVIAEALRMGESNACMKRIVAAPTAGSCGVLPAVLIPFARANKTGDREITSALFVAAGFGQIIASRASISGAEGGCQAEIGSASAMAAAALVCLKNGTPEMSACACSMALMNLLGLVCDPVAGLVEIPCVKRNVIGAVNAISCADMALAGIGSAIPPDEVIDSMRSVGDMMPACLRETGTGGLAATPTGAAAAKKIHGIL